MVNIANTGDSNYRRQVHLRETAMDILQILDRKVFTLDRYITLTHWINIDPH